MLCEAQMRKKKMKSSLKPRKNGALNGKATSMLFKDALCGNQSRKCVPSFDESV